MSVPRMSVLRMSLLRMSLFVGVLPAAGAAQDDVADLVRKLGAKDHRVRHDAYRKLRTQKPAAALPLLAKAMPGYPLQSQNLAFSVLHMFPREQAEPVLRRFLEGSSSFLALNSAIWLYQRGDRAVAPHVARALRDAETEQEISMMLSRCIHLKIPGLTDAVLELVQPHASVNVLDQALRYLSRNRHAPAISVVAKMLEEPDLRSQQRMLCAGFLVSMGEKAHVEELAEAIREAKNLGRVRQFLNDAPSLDRKVLSAILDFVDGKRGHEVGYALQILAKHDYMPAVRKMRELLEHDDVVVSTAAFDALMKMGNGLPSKHLKRLLGSKKTQVTIAAADALRRLDDHSGLPQLVDIAKRPGKYRRDAAEALGKFRSRKSVPVLIELMDDQDRQVRDAAFRGLSRILRGLFPYKSLDIAAVGYTSTAPAAKRREAVARIRHWWKLQGPGKK